MNSNLKLKKKYISLYEKPILINFRIQLKCSISVEELNTNLDWDFECSFEDNQTLECGPYQRQMHHLEKIKPWK